ncbi:hypothetical protein [Cupriavidus taiwanensis]|uniref:HEAT repeat domain-containing protein n=1 Tax=Cupriavidus taiwanensis (strain DSM 17343 / BCRC 17206 / CCUG 44338 / CIP 107171 / LMG 19424 / R1) TaxID=977880 RepID=B3R1C2_CUPTR|nr:hypothetical protein [Cupriavidus taiwanensis]CAQ69531.1 conserved hypothetical protein [Cupriavidus taiwanensis LMG 19424]
MTMRYQEPARIPNAEIDHVLASGNPEAIADACLSIAYYEDDWEWAFKRLKSVAFDLNRPDSLRSLAVTCVGHLARRIHDLDVAMAEEFLLSLGGDQAVASAASDALDDLRIFRMSD